MFNLAAAKFSNINVFLNHLKTSVNTIKDTFFFMNHKTMSVLRVHSVAVNLGNRDEVFYMQQSTNNKY